MEHWERHFAEKSRRRFEAQRSQRRRHRVSLAITIAVVAIVVLGGIVTLAVLR